MTAFTPDLPTTVPVRVRPAAAVSAASGDETDQIARILTNGYVDTPQSRWLIKDRDERLITLSQFWLAMVRYSQHYAHIDVATGHADAVIGVAIWFNTCEPGDPASYRRYVTAACRQHADRFLRYDQMLAEHQPHPATDVSGMRLAWLAVARHHRDRGVGSALLRHRHGLLDAEGRPATAIATGKALRLCARHGYDPHQPFRLPDGPRLWPMVRAPRTGTEPGDDTPTLSAPAAGTAVPDPGS